MSIWLTSLESFRNRIAADTPVPSCGATSCVCASFGLALLLMALRKSDTRHLEDQREKNIHEVEQLMDVMKAHADNDVRAFSAYIEEPLSDAQGHSQQRTLEVTLGALAAARGCLQGIELAQCGLPCVKPSLQCDVVAAVLILHASLSALLLNVDSDVDQIVPSARRAELAQDRRDLQQKADEALARAWHQDKTFVQR
ncbi:methenyl tetrahydrofolate cyclohydrolase [Pseudomonas sp. GM78]|nr:methenyl tetrahydrofolate cyclohydrolase [Pseudomonas sp. GM78]